jgi:hypothetical protein
MTQQVVDDDLILHLYGEAPEPVEQHLTECGECRARYQGLQRVMNIVDIPVPERPTDYEQQVWDRLAPAIGLRKRWSWVTPRKWVSAFVLASALLAAFLAGRYSPRPGGIDAIDTAKSPVRERVLIVAVGDHLERSQMVLAELVNADPESTDLNIEGERDLAENLLNENRLYRQTASAAGDTGIATLLDDLERVLLEIARSPGTISTEQLKGIRERVEQQGLLFKIRVVGSRLRDPLTEKL